ncbi:hypothetical protein O6H91_02G073900 [Diphasiastrum complanatum]|uniref:Uncharacterized protein n=1 Tax=Diphasiastrum complanatum TaxID=34168 RepID=A0ACC2EH67_DIPCM|nr:hypothetical protein O6H91_02G073900 [Diphasiastrum complanatum]
MARRLVRCSSCHTELQGPRAISCAHCRCHTAPPPSYLQRFLHGRSHIHSLPSLQSDPLRYSPTPDQGQGSKKAVICGISYRNTKFELDGCINDAKCMKYLLQTKFEFPESTIVMLTEEETDRWKIPTKHNIRNALRWLVQGCRSGDSLVFHFSGHGLQQRNYNGEELDGYDETICPLDFKTQGVIVDDEINETIVRPLTHGVRLHAIMDACHSGTVLDLPFLWGTARYGCSKWEDHRPRTGTWKGTNGGEAFCFSGCDDSQSSADTSVLSNVTSTGAMTFCFIQAIEYGDGNTYASLLQNIRQNIHQKGFKKGKCVPISALMQMLLASGSQKHVLIQEPQLSASYMFDVNTLFRL